MVYVPDESLNRNKRWLLGSGITTAVPESMVQGFPNAEA